jgi:FecR protein
MNRKAIIIAAALSGLIATPPALAQTVGVNAAIRNQVQIATGTDRTLRKAVLKERVGLGDDVATGPASVLQILLLDRTTVTVGANARMRIDRFVFDPNRSASAVGASVAKGAFRFMSGKALRGSPGQSSIRTPVGSIGVRGTIFEGVVGPDAVRIAMGEQAVGTVTANAESATLIVLRGPGAATQGDERRGAIDFEANGKVIAMEQPGLALFVPAPDAAPIGPFAISDAGLLALHDLLRTSPTRRAAGDFAPETNPVVDFIFECEASSFSPIVFDPVIPNSSSFSSSSSSISSSSSSSAGCYSSSSQDVR